MWCTIFYAEVQALAECAEEIVAIFLLVLSCVIRLLVYMLHLIRSLV